RGTATDHADVDIELLDLGQLAGHLIRELAQPGELAHHLVRELVEHRRAGHQRVVIEALGEQKIDRAEQVDLGRRKRVLAVDLSATYTRRLTRTQVRHTRQPDEATAAVALETEERPRPVILERSRQHARPARERRRRDTLVGECTNGGVADAKLDGITARKSRKPPR